MKKKLIVLILVLLSVTAITQASLHWGSGGNGDFFDENRWVDNNSQIPTANTINPNSAITAATGGSIRMDRGSAVEVTASAGNIWLGNNSFEINQKLSMSGNGLRVDGTTTGSPANIGARFYGGSIASIRYLADINATLASGSTLRLYGSGTPLSNDSRILISDTNSVLQFMQRDWSEFDSQERARVTVGSGAALVFGNDPYTAEVGDNALATSYNNGNGIQIEYIDPVPEPATLGILAFFSGAILFIRKRILM